MRAKSCLQILFILFFCCLSSITLAADEHRNKSQREKLEWKAGDRVVLIGNTFADQLRLYNYLETLLTSLAPAKNITFRNLAWSGDTLNLRPRPLNFGSLDDHLHQQKADIIIACFGMNESFAGQDGLKEFSDSWEKFLNHLASQKYNGTSTPRVVLISPIAHENRGPPFPDPAGHNQNLSDYTRAMQVVAARHHLPFVDLFSETKKLMDENPSQKLTRNGIHLNQYGYWALSQFVAGELLGKKIKSPQLVVDLADQKIQTTNAEILQQNFKPDKIQFTVKEKVLPIPAPPESAIVHSELLASQPRLTVKNLPTGNYRLLVNETRIAEASHADWDRGLQLKNLPARSQVKDLRATIERKNELFFYVYRAHNAEYIFGRRTKPFGAVSFPPEMEAFARLIQSRETNIKKQSHPDKESRWILFKLE
ncbi:MAG: SGNH/GDSL hydrolase family protein [Planctomycetes bacterium]|nr:SGNH/GDSL hydrolase family protein [Planctomycetota bacterium]MCH9724907.1 SGNH/GDSL hydrolase family protein [Planctomycetota bacterium]MCH9776866.1 SGNH/GDSL hydrolase family protein [Planctomycetota bacterium]MCH9790374.1 SGNH/GDSL hydrolase family protein [Planctomycetota bacterium]